MGLIRDLFTRPAVEDRGLDTITGRDLWADHYVPSATTQAEASVTVGTAMREDTVFACVTLTSDVIANLPGAVFQGDGPNKVRLDPQPRWTTQPAEYDTIQDLTFKIVASLLTDGNAYLEVVPNARNEVATLAALDPNAVTPLQPPHGPRGTFDVQLENGPIVRVPHATRRNLEGILHLRCFPWPGQAEGLSPIGLQRATIGSAIEARDFGNTYWENGAIPGGVIETEQDLTEDDMRDLAVGWDQIHRGRRGSNRPAVLTNGAAWKDVQIPTSDLQWLEARSFSAAGIARIFRVPLHMIGHHEKATTWGAGLESLTSLWFATAIGPISGKVERPFGVFLLPAGQTYSLDPSPLLRTDPTRHMDKLSKGIQSGVMTINEARAEVELPDIGPDGDVNYVPLNMTTAAELDEPEDVGPPPDELVPPELTVITEDEETSGAGA